MKKITFQYEMQIDFSSVATNHSFTLKCIPHSDQRQEILDLKLEVLPNLQYENGTDSFGNCYIFGNYADVHSKFCVKMTGIAVTGIQDYVTGEEDLLAIYKKQDTYTEPGTAICKAFHRFYEKKETDRETAIHMMHRLYENFTYQSGVTNVQTTAEEAMQQGMGVCQDYSHILLSLCRMAHIPARYVVGMLEGEGASHAWVEVYSNGAWYALDPTNNLVVTDEHVTISHGRNYRDCIMNKGVFCGGGSQVQTVQVKLTGPPIDSMQAVLDKCGLL